MVPLLITRPGLRFLALLFLNTSEAVGVTPDSVGPRLVFLFF
jgi:hypothetical protein